MFAARALPLLTVLIPALPCQELVADLNKTNVKVNANFPRHLTPLGNKVYFSAEEPFGNREPWVSDGTPRGTFQLAEVEPGTRGTVNLQGFSHIGNGVVLFYARTSLGSEIWRTDGTKAGTARVKNLGSLILFSDKTWLVSAGKFAYFRGEQGKLGITDGTPAGTRLVPAPPTGIRPSSLPNMSKLVAIDDTLFFAAKAVRGSSENLGVELFRTRGTRDSTAIVEDLNPGSASANPQELTRSGS